MSLLIETQYLPTLEFFSVISKDDTIIIEHYEHFVKQSYRNHTLINTANGMGKMVIPLSDKGNRTFTKDVKLDASKNWRNVQWRTIESAYRKAPYYEHYVDDLRKILHGNQTFLIDLNHELLSMCLNWLGWSKKISASLSYQTNPPDTIDLRNILLSKKSYSTRNFFLPKVYKQVFGQTFVENLSLVDLIFCKGPEASSIILASTLNH